MQLQPTLYSYFYGVHTYKWTESGESDALPVAPRSTRSTMAVKPKGRADTGDARNVLKKPSQWRSDVPSIESHASGAVANGMPLLKPIDSELTE